MARLGSRLRIGAVLVIWCALAVPVAQGEDTATTASPSMPAVERDALSRAIVLAGEAQGRIDDAASSLRICMPDWCPAFFDDQLSRLDTELKTALAEVPSCLATGCDAVAAGSIAKAREALRPEASRACEDCEPGVPLMSGLLASWSGFGTKAGTALRAGDPACAVVASCVSDIALPQVQLAEDVCSANTLRERAAAPEVCGKSTAEIAADAQTLAGTVTATVLGLTDAVCDVQTTTQAAAEPGVCGKSAAELVEDAQGLAASVQAVVAQLHDQACGSALRQASDPQVCGIGREEVSQQIDDLQALLNLTVEDAMRAVCATGTLGLRAAVAPPEICGKTAAEIVADGTALVSVLTGVVNDAYATACGLAGTSVTTGTKDTADPQLCGSSVQEILAAVDPPARGCANESFAALEGDMQGVAGTVLPRLTGATRCPLPVKSLHDQVVAPVTTLVAMLKALLPTCQSVAGTALSARQLADASYQREAASPAATLAQNDLTGTVVLEGERPFTNGYVVVTTWPESFVWTGAVPTADIDGVLGVAEIDLNGTWAVEKMVIPADTLQTIEGDTAETHLALTVVTDTYIQVSDAVLKVAPLPNSGYVLQSVSGGAPKIGAITVASTSPGVYCTKDGRPTNDPDGGEPTATAAGHNRGRCIADKEYDEARQLAVGEIHTWEDIDARGVYARMHHGESTTGIGVNSGSGWHAAGVTSTITNSTGDAVESPVVADGQVKNFTVRTQVQIEEGYKWTGPQDAGKKCAPDRATPYLIDDLDKRADVKDPLPMEGDARFNGHCGDMKVENRTLLSPDEPYQKEEGRAVKLNGGITIFGLTLGSQSGYSTNVIIRWRGGREFRHHFLCGPTTTATMRAASIIYAGPSYKRA